MLDTSSRGREHVGSARARGRIVGSGRIVGKSEKKGKAKPIQKPEIVSSEASRTQWTVKGIDKETLEASRIAARKRGMKFGAWVNEVLLAAASGDAFQNLGNGKELLSKIAHIEFKLDQSVNELKQQTDHIQHDGRILHLLVPKSGAR